ncbi:alpha/beta hydrolase family esterase [Kaarinaea lacus]
MSHVYCRPNLTHRGKLVTGFVIGLLISLAMPGVSAAASMELKGGSKTEVSFVLNNENYNILLHLPEANSSNDSYPLMIVVSGVGDRLSRFVRATGFSKITNRESVVVAFVQLDQHDNWYNWLRLSRETENQGADFIRSIIARISSEVNIQMNKIYLTGFSAGGMLVLTAMCDLSSTVAAFGVVSASLPSEWQTQCPTKRSVPAIIFASRDDPVLPWNGGKIAIPLTVSKTLNVLSVSDTVDLWRWKNKCNARPLIEAFANADPSDGTTVTRLKYDFQCHNSSQVLLYAVTGGGHSWPGSITKLRSFEGAISQDIRASDTIWEFVKNYRLDH